MITEKVYQPFVNGDVITHQFLGDKHRIIVNTNDDKEIVSEWMNKDQIASIDYYEATWKELLGFPSGTKDDELKNKIKGLLEDYIIDLEHLWQSCDSNSGMKSYREKQDEIRNVLEELH